MDSVPFSSYAIAHDSSNTEIFLLTRDSSNPAPTGTFPSLQQYGHYSTLRSSTAFSQPLKSHSQRLAFYAVLP